MMVFKRRQIVVLALVLLVVVAGYLQYTYKKSSVSTQKDEGKLGEAVYVDNKDLTGADIVTNDSSEGTTVAKTKDTGASRQANDFFAQAKLDKEMVRSKDTDTLKQITEDVNASKEVISQAYDQMMKIVDSAEKEMRIETLIKEKGFTDVITLFGDDGSVDIVVKTPSLTSAQTAQISDIVSRQGKIDMAKIHIRSIY